MQSKMYVPNLIIFKHIKGEIKQSMIFTKNLILKKNEWNKKIIIRYKIYI